MKKLSIIISHHDTPELLDLCIKSIKETIKGLDYEVFIADSESKEGNQDFIKEKHPKVEFIVFAKNLGYSKTVNAGIKASDGDYVLILNADIIILGNAVSEMVDFMDKNPKVGIVAPQLLDFTNNIQTSCFSNPNLKTIIVRRTFLGKTKWGKKILDKFTMADWDKNSIKEVDWTQGSAMLVRREAIEKVGLFDEKFFMYFDDADWCRRFWQKGYKVIYLPSAKMAHYYHRSSKKFGAIFDIIFNKYARTHIISAIKYFKKYDF
ncbi:MAG TPA: glycosyltransferase family 2 protein [Candidatus Paceibacterota bacterium]|nr:glycosyltransferase family 2 protein [Candidatus Paceibacterota bacterium]